MDSFVEKITLYDFFSYFVPGALCMVLCVCGVLPELTQYQDYMNDFKGYIGVAFVAFSYVGGVAISEIARLFCTIIPKKLCKCLCRKNKPPKWVQKLNIDDQSLKSALMESGISQNSIESEMKKYAEEEGRSSLAECFGIQIYSDIQVDPKYKRIHNYSSSESMNKNIAFAFLFSGVVAWFLKRFLHVQILKNFSYLFALEMVLAVVFLIRWKSFEEKTNLYAVNWFVEKYKINGKETAEND